MKDHVIIIALDSNMEIVSNHHFLGAAMREIGLEPSEDELKELIGNVDEDDNGTIEFDEYLEMLAKMNKKDDIDIDIMEAFIEMDANGNGFLDHEEIKRALVKIGEKPDSEEIQALIAEADVNGDGQVDYKEFAKLMKG